ncbi:MAG TPA: DUF983 domain-containing protein [Candidatus Limnocylindrales bacterium]|nr:DUF983 domain-containing protein [Candidatus Limnocylindrales bacterium]
MNKTQFIKTVLWRGLRKYCPRCGQGQIFHSLFKMNIVCPICKQEFSREGGAMIGGMYVSAAITQAFAILLIVSVWVFTDWSPTFSIAICAPLAALFSFWFLPYSKAIWVSVDYLIDVFSGESTLPPSTNSGDRWNL